MERLAGRSLKAGRMSKGKGFHDISEDVGRHSFRFSAMAVRSGSSGCIAIFKMTAIG